MKAKIITASLLALIRLLMDSDLLKEVMELVRALMNDNNLTGVAKKQKITDELNDVKNEFFEIVTDMSSWILSAAIDIGYAYLMSRK